MYLDLSGDKTRCIREQDCKHMFYDGVACLTWPQCSSMSRYMYVDGPKLECVSNLKCGREGGHIYHALWECLKIPADTSNGGFMERFKTENVYQCVSGRNLLIGDVATCVLPGECKRVQQSRMSIVCYEKVCP